MPWRGALLWLKGTRTRTEMVSKGEFLRVFVMAAGVMAVSTALSEVVHNTVLLKVGVAQLVTFRKAQTARLVLDNVTNFAFFVYEVHTHALPVVMDLDIRTAALPAWDHALVVRIDESKLGQYVFVTNKNEYDVQGLALVRGYHKEDPVPAMGNNNAVVTSLHSNKTIAIRPEIKVTWDDYTTTILFKEAGSLSKPGGHLVTNEGTSLVYRYDVYQYWFKEGDFDRDNYLEGLAGMLFKTDIEENGYLVGHHYLERTESGLIGVTFPAFPGTVQLFAVIVTTVTEASDGNEESFQSVYSASVTTGCRMTVVRPKVDDDAKDNFVSWRCDDVYYMETKLLAAASVVLAAFLLTAGNRYLATSQIIFGMFIGGCATYPVMATLFATSHAAALVLPVGCGLIAGFLARCVWKCLGVPLLSIALPNLLTGALLAITVVQVANLLQGYVMTQNTIYYGTLGAITGAYFLFMAVFHKRAHLLSCAMLGAFTLAVCVDHYLGSTIKFILLNFFRRIFVPNYRCVCCQLPFQDNEVVVVVTWAVAFVLSFAVQSWQKRHWPTSGSTPLASSNFNVTPVNVSAREEATPLLHPSPEYLVDLIISAPPPEYPGGARERDRQENVGYGAVFSPSPSFLRAYQDPQFYVDRDIQMTPSRPRPPDANSQNRPRAKDIFKPPDLETQYSPV